MHDKVGLVRIVGSSLDKTVDDGLIRVEDQDGEPKGLEPIVQHVR